MGKTSAVASPGEGKILRYDVFKEIHSGEPFDMAWITCNRKKGTGGDIISAEGWMVVSDQPRETKDVKSETTENPSLKGEAKDPNHPDNGTVNIFNPANSGVHIHKVHIDLIQFFNGKRVIN